MLLTFLKKSISVSAQKRIFPSNHTTQLVPDRVIPRLIIFLFLYYSCEQSVETRYHCTICDDFDLCIKCYSREGHPHKMEKLGFDLGGAAEGEGSKNGNPDRVSAIQRCIQVNKIIIWMKKSIFGKYGREKIRTITSNQRTMQQCMEQYLQILLESERIFIVKFSLHLPFIYFFRAWFMPVNVEMPIVALLVVTK